MLTNTLLMILLSWVWMPALTVSRAAPATDLAGDCAALHSVGSNCQDPFLTLCGPGLFRQFGIHKIPGRGAGHIKI